jgi:hypothetical protein
MLMVEFGVYPLPSGWDGTFKIGDDQQSVIMSTKIPRSVYNAQTILQCHGFDDNNIHVVSLQAAMNKAKKQQSKAPNKDFIERKLFGSFPTK